MSPLKRGCLIVIEGCDRSGKTTQCKKLEAALQDRNIKASYINFPDRTTNIGQMIDKYLVSKVDMADESIHLLFSANRWEWAAKITNLINDGVTLIVDRYAFSGVAFSAAKGLDLNWCKSPDIGLPKPDRVFLLTLSPEAQASRSGFGEERYEMSDFQKKVMSNFAILKDSSWKEIDANRTVDELHEDLKIQILEILHSAKSDHLEKLWIK